MFHFDLKLGGVVEVWLATVVLLLHHDKLEIINESHKCIPLPLLENRLCMLFAVKLKYFIYSC